MPLNKKIEKSVRQLRSESRTLRSLPSDRKNELLIALATELEANTSGILKANAKDLKELKKDSSAAFRDRLTLNPQRIQAMAESLRQVAALADPVGEVLESRTLPNGLALKKIRAPLGIILMIFESRPNVILEAFSLAFKSGNSIILRGGSESQHSARALYRLMKSVMGPNTFYGIEDYNRAHVTELLKRKDLIDVTVPRGGERLIEFVQKTATMPIIKNDRGLCHAYVDENADLDMAVRIVANAKVQRPGVCNSLETVLVHKAVAHKFIPQLYDFTSDVNLAWRVDVPSFKILNKRARVKKASNNSWDTEYLDLILNCRIVEDLEEALAHIEKHGSKHSETIITRDEHRARRFQMDVDAAAVYWNASTRFTDGFEFGLGGELGISTQKLHVRGPVGLRELTTPRWIGNGTGQVRE